MHFNNTVTDAICQDSTFKDSVLQAALEYAAKGWHVLPLHTVSANGQPVYPLANPKSWCKAPATAHGVKDATNDPGQLRALFGAAAPLRNIGIATGPLSNLTIIDIDDIAAWDALAAQHPPIVTYTVETGSGGRHLYFLHDERLRHGTNRLGPGIDVLNAGGYGVAAPSRSAKGCGYTVVDATVPPARVPDWIVECCETPPRANALNSDERVTRELAAIAEPLAAIPSDDRTQWINLGLAIKHQFGDAGFDTWHAWSSKSPAYAGYDDCRKTWDTLQPTGDIGVGSIIYAAKNAHWQPKTPAPSRIALPKDFGSVLSPQKRLKPTLPNLRNLLAEHDIRLSYDPILKRQAIQFGPDTPLHSSLQNTASIACLRSLFAEKNMPYSALDLLPQLFLENTRNPLLEFIESVPWDGVDRRPAMHATLDVASEDVEYRNAVMDAWCVQSIAALDGARRTPLLHAIPRYDLVMVLQGAQGCGKTSWIRAMLANAWAEYILDGLHLDPADKDSLIVALSAWIVELGELDATFRRAEISRLKAFLSRLNDRIRLPYDAAYNIYPRQTSFCASVNPVQFLTDSTGSRRFAPIRVRQCNVHHGIDMQQFWAQMLHHYCMGQSWWGLPAQPGVIEKASFAEIIALQSEQHQETDPIAEMIVNTFDLTATSSQRHYNITRILQLCGIREPKPHQLALARAFLEKRGFKRVQSHGIVGFWLALR